MGGSVKVWIDFVAPTWDADDLNGFNQELNNAITANGQTISYTDRTQLAKSLWNNWQSNLSYIVGSIVRKINTLELYVSLVSPNLNNALPSKISNSNWEYLGSLDALEGTYFDSLVAHSGGTQSLAIQLYKGSNRITTCAADGDSTKLPNVFNTNDTVVVLNDGASLMAIYPASGDAIEGFATDAPFYLSPGGRITFKGSTANTLWKIINIINGGLYNSITAYAGSEQLNATKINIGMNVISVCASSGGSTKLPNVFNITDSVAVKNNGAKRAYLYPASGHSIVGLSANIPISVLPGNTIELVAITATTWELVSGFIQITSPIQLLFSSTPPGGTSSWAKAKIEINTLENGNDATKGLMLADVDMDMSFSLVTSGIFTFSKLIWANIGSFQPICCFIQQDVVLHRTGTGRVDSNTGVLEFWSDDACNRLIVSGKYYLQSQTMV